PAGSRLRRGGARAARGAAARSASDERRGLPSGPAVLAPAIPVTRPPARPRGRISPGRPSGRVSPARACALRVIRRVFEQGAYADRAFTGEAAELEPRDRALAMALSYGTVQRRATLDYVAA